MSEVGILIIDDDVASQRALKSVLDSEGWRVRIVPEARQALTELATGAWNLAIVNVGVATVNGPLFAILRELSDAGSRAKGQNSDRIAKKLSVFFLVPVRLAAAAQPVLEAEDLPYSLKPYHLHEFFEKVSDLLVESGAIEEPIRAMGNFSLKRRPAPRSSRHARRGSMFASREDYQMTEEEMAEYERQEEEERKKREKERKDREHL